MDRYEAYFVCGGGSDSFEEVLCDASAMGVFEPLFPDGLRAADHDPALPTLIVSVGGIRTATGKDNDVSESFF